MQAPDLHIVTFSVPYPPVYGGAMEVWNRINALHREGVRIHLHAFVYGPYLPHEILKEVTTEVHYYPRSVWPVLFAKGLPFVISSRKHPQLLKRLELDRIPVLFEGVQTTGWLDDLPDRKRFLRAHNVEHKYYQQLAQNSGGFRSMIFNREAQCLEEYEKGKAKLFDKIFTISAEDDSWFTLQGGNSVHLPPFHGFTKADIEPGKGSYVLYQGDLSIEINQRALLELIRMIPERFELPLVAAGRSGDHAFESKISSFPNLRREADVSQEKMTALIRHAQVILIHSLHGEGMKMKLYPALFQGRFIAANSASRTNSPLDQAIDFYERDSFADRLWALISKIFTTADIDHRKTLLANMPDDATHARQIIRYL